MPKLSQVTGGKLKLSQVTGTPDFSNVRAGSSSTEEYSDSDYKVRAQRAEDEKRYNPTKGMAPAELQKAGFFQSFANTGRGLKQLGVDIADIGNARVHGALQAIGADDAAQSYAGNFGLPVHQYRQQVQREVDDARAMEAPLLDTAHGFGGSVAGNLTQLLGPGIGLRGTTVGRALLPTTIRGSAVQGAALGASQPVATGESRTVNTAVGGTVGAAVPAALKVPGAVKRAVQSALRSPEERAGREAVSVIQREAGNADLMTPNPSQVPGAARTLFEETQNPGVARLETASRGAPGTNWPARDIAENQARVQAIGTFAGDEGTLAAARQARSDSAVPALNRAQAEGANEVARAIATMDAGVPYMNPQTGHTIQRVQDGYRVTPNGGGESTVMNAAEVSRFLEWSGVPAGGVDTAPVLAEINGLIARYTGNPSMQSALQTVKAQIQASGGDLGYLENARQTAGDLITRTPDGTMRRLPQMIEAKDALTGAMRDTSDDFGRYLDTWQELSRPINQMEVGQEILNRGSGGIMDEAGNYVLTPGKFGQTMKNLDDVAASATGFPRATAAGTLEPAQLGTLGAVNEDLGRQSRRLTYGSGGGSHTASQLGVMGRVNEGVWRAIERIPGGQLVAAGRAVLKEQNAEHLTRAMERVLANPAEYRAIAQLLSREDSRALENALVRLGAQGGQAVTRVESSALAE